jgi:enterochelin esterase-like enzyme
MHALAVVAAAAALLPGFSPAQAGPDGGQVLTGVFPGTERPGAVYLPPGFDPARRYPVVYLLHGMPGSPSEYLSGTTFLASSDAGIESGALRPFIAVLPAAGPDRGYNGEWAGPWETALVDDVVPWVDAHLPTRRTASGRVLAGLSAGGYGAFDIGLRNPGVFGAIESWSGYFRPLHDGPFAHADAALLTANDPTQLAPAEAAFLQRRHVRFFLSTGPAHSHWFTPQETIGFATELQTLALPATLRLFADLKGEWSAQVTAGLAWAFSSS